MSDYIPPEIISDILSRLPVKSLLRFRCVCKSWLSLIDSHDFIYSHLDHSLSNRFIITRDYDVHACRIDGFLVTETDAFGFENFSAEDKSYAHGDVVGCVNGIVCLCLDGFDLVLWNPSTRKHFQMPPAPSGVFGRYALGKPRFGFGLNSMSWTRAKGVPHPGRRRDDTPAVRFVWRRPVRLHGESGQFVGGALHWCLTPASTPGSSLECINYTILAFNLSTEEHQLLFLPNFGKQIFQTTSVALEDTLGVVCSHKLGNIDVWVMKKYGVEEPWTRLISVDQWKVVRPLVYSKDGEHVLLEKNRKELVWYDLESENVKETEIQAVPKFSQGSFVYIESLVQLPCPSKVVEDEDNAKEKITKPGDGLGCESSKSKEVTSQLA